MEKSPIEKSSIEKSPMEKIFELLDQNQKDQAVKLIIENVSKRDQSFIEDLVPSLNIIANISVEVVEEIMSSLLAILNFEDDMIRYSLILSLRKFVQEHPNLILPYIEDYLNYGSPKKREGMLLLILYITEKNPDILKPYYKEIIQRLADKEDYVRKRSIEILKTIGKEDRNEIEVKILEFLKEAKEDQNKKDAVDELIKSAEIVMTKKPADKPLEPQDQVLILAADRALKKGADGIRKAAEDELNKAADTVLKGLIDVETIEKKELEKRQREAEAKALQEKLEENEQELALEKLKLEQEQREIEQERLAQEKDRLVREKQIIEKQKELEDVKRELKLKRLEEEKATIIEEETKRLEKKMKELKEKTNSNPDFEDLI
jgi:hypothetical protein